MAWTKTQKNGYDIYTETGLVLADNGGTNIEKVTVTSALPDGINWEDTKFPLTVDMTIVAGAAVVVDAILQTSVNGTTSDDVIGTASSLTPSWVDSATIDINVASAGTANHSQEVDATDIWAPYARFALVTAATDLTDAAGRCTISFAHKPSKPNNVGLAAGDFAGIGADPS